jgi:hypothetical protein
MGFRPREGFEGLLPGGLASIAFAANLASSARDVQAVRVDTSADGPLRCRLSRSWGSATPQEGPEPWEPRGRLKRRAPNVGGVSPSGCDLPERIFPGTAWILAKSRADCYEYRHCDRSSPASLGFAAKAR